MLRPQPHQLLAVALSCETSLLAIIQYARRIIINVPTDQVSHQGVISNAVFTSCQFQSSNLRCHAVSHRPFCSDSSSRSHAWEGCFKALGDNKSTKRLASWHQQHIGQLLLLTPHSYALGGTNIAHGAAIQHRGIAASAMSGLSAASTPVGTGQEDVQEDANSKARAITRSIRDAVHSQELQNIVEQQGSCFNAIHTAAAFSKAAKLAGGSTVGAAPSAGSTNAGSTSACSTSAGSASAGSTSAGSASAGSRNAGSTSAGGTMNTSLQLLAQIWQRCFEEAAPRELASVLYACSKLAYTDHLLWDSTLSMLTQPRNLQKANAQDLSTAAYAVAATAGTLSAPSAAAADPSPDNSHALAGQSAGAVLQTLALQLTKVLRSSAAGEASCHSISNVLWALAKLDCSLAEPDLVVFLQALAQPKQLAAADARSVASSLWAVSQMQQLPAAAQQQQPLNTQPHSESQAQQKLQPGSGDIWSQLLRQELIEQIAQGSPQAVSNTLRALARLSSGARHPVSVPLAQHCAEQLLRGNTAKQLNTWNAQDIGSSMWACGKLGIRDLHLFEQAAASSELWLPCAMAPVISQVAWACAKLKYRNQQFVEGIMQQGRHLMHRDHGQAPLLPHQAERTALAATLSWTVATLNLTQLAGDIKALISASGIKQQEDPLTAADARALWHVHGWLHHNQLLGGHGLSKLLTEQQLASCAEASRHTHRRTPPAHIAVKLQQQQQQEGSGGQ